MSTNGSLQHRAIFLGQNALNIDLIIKRAKLDRKRSHENFREKTQSFTNHAVVPLLPDKYANHAVRHSIPFSGSPADVWMSKSLFYGTVQ